MNKFDKWFKEQFGKLPNPAKLLKVEKKVSDFKSELFLAELERGRLLEIAIQYQAASYAYKLER